MKYLCELFGVTKQAFYKRNDEGNHRRLAKEQIALEYIREIRTKDPGIGCRKLYHMYSDAFSDTHIGRDAFEALMAENGLKIRCKKRKPRTTDSRHKLPTYPDLTKNLLPSRSNELWVADITYISLCEPIGLPKYCYLSLLMDAYTEEVKGWAVGATLETKYPLEALQMAMDNLDTQREDLHLIHHSDRGVQYASNEYVEVLKKAGIAISMTETGNPKDNARAERINSTFKNELLKDKKFRDVEEVKQAVRVAVEFYNNERPHMSINMMTPAEAASMTGEITKRWRSYRDEALKNKAKVTTYP